MWRTRSGTRLILKRGHVSRSQSNTLAEGRENPGSGRTSAFSDWTIGLYTLGSCRSRHLSPRLPRQAQFSSSSLPFPTHPLSPTSFSSLSPPVCRLRRMWSIRRNLKEASTASNVDQRRHRQHRGGGGGVGIVRILTHFFYKPPVYCLSLRTRALSMALLAERSFTRSIVVEETEFRGASRNEDDDNRRSLNRMTDRFGVTRPLDRKIEDSAATDQQGSTNLVGPSWTFDPQ